MEKERIISITNEGKTYFIYFTGELQYDENIFGKPIQSEVFYYLDEDFNKLVLNISKEDAEHYVGIMQKNAELYGRELFVGSHSPEIEDVHGDYVPNTNPNTVGIWRVSTREEKSNYIRILQKQSEERMYLKLYNNK